MVRLQRNMDSNTQAIEGAADRRNDQELLRFGALLDQAAVLVYVIDAETSIVVDLNEAALRNARLKRADIVGHSMRALRISFPLQTETQWKQFIHMVSGPEGLLVELDLGQRGGGVFLAKLHFAIQQFSGRRYLVATGKAVDERPVRLGQIERQNVWKTALLELTSSPEVIEGHIRDACQLVAVRAAEAMPSGGAGVWVRDPNTPFLLLPMSTTGLANGAVIDLSGCPELVRLLEFGRPFDAFGEGEEAQKAFQSQNAMACLAAPIRVAGSVAGALLLLHHQARNWSHDDMCFAGMAADQAATALINAEYRRVQRSIQQSEERYRKFVNNSSEGIWRVEFEQPIPLHLPVEEQVRLFMERGVLAECNKAFAGFYGSASVSDVEGRRVSEIFRLQDPRALDELHQMTRAGFQVQDSLISRLDQNGRELWFLRNMHGDVEDGCLVRLWGCSREATRRKLAEDLLNHLANARTGPDFFKSLVSLLVQSTDACEASVIGLDVDTGEPKVLARFVDGEFSEEMASFEAKEQDEAWHLKPLLDSSGTRIGMVQVLFRDPVEERSLVDSALQAFAGRAAAELERARYQESLERSHQRYKSFVELSSESIWRLDLKEPLSLDLNEQEQVEHFRNKGFLAECNQASALQLDKETPDQLIGLPVKAIYPEEQAERNNELVEIVRSGYALTNQEVCHIRPDGSRRWILRSMTGIHSGNYLAGCWGVSRDITDIKNMQQQIQALSGRRQEVLEEERARISREIHDDLGQQLSGLKMHLASLARAQKGLLSQFEEAIGLVDGVIGATRRIAADLRPLILDHFGLSAAIEHHVNEFARASGLICDCDVDQGIDVSKGQALAIFRILQESLTNVLRHSKGTEVMITLINEESDLVFRVSDNGRGMPDKAKQAGFSGGLGLAGMRERALAYGGDLLVSSQPGRGAAVEARFPAAKPALKKAAV